MKGIMNIRRKVFYIMNQKSTIFLVVIAETLLNVEQYYHLILYFNINNIVMID